MGTEGMESKLFLMNQLREHIRQLNKQIEMVSRVVSWLEETNEGKSTGLNESEKTSFVINLFAGSRFEKVIEVLKNERDWMTPLEIRSAYRRKTNEFLPESSLRQFLTENEPDLFVRDGFNKTTRWRIRELVTEDQ